IILANALVSSKLDYLIHFSIAFQILLLTVCSLFKMPLPELLYTSVKRFHHILPTLKMLHWLPIRERISFKIASLTCKTLHHRQPSYLHELIKPYQPPRPLRSSDKHMLDVPDVRSAQGQRSFLFAAPTIWNSLPISLRCFSSVASFLSGLKTHPFSLHFSS